MPRPIHFEIQAENPERAISFYQSLFGWTFSQWGQEKYWLITTGDKAQPGIDGGLLPRPVPGGPAEMAAVNAFVCTVDVRRSRRHAGEGRGLERRASWSRAWRSPRSATSRTPRTPKATSSA